MSSDLTDEQRALRQVTIDLLASECPPAVVREAWASDTGRSDALWGKLSEVGLTGMTVPTDNGGMGMSEFDASLVLEPAGRVVLPEPLLETVGVVAPTIADVGTDEQRSTWLPRIAGGDARATVQLPTQTLVSDAHVADVLVTVVGDSIHIVGSDRFTVRPQPAFDGARRLALVDARVDDTTRAATRPEDVESLVDRAAVATAAVLVGVSAALLEMTLSYVKDREQFGRPIGSFQAIKHKLAESHLLVETARQAVRAAAAELALKAPTSSVTASVAKSYAADAARRVNYESLQCHGGVGFTWEADLHLWLKRGKALEQAYGTARWHRQRIAAALFNRAPVGAASSHGGNR